MRTSKSFVLVPCALAAAAGLLLASGQASAQVLSSTPPGPAVGLPPRPLVVATQPKQFPPPPPAEPTWRPKHSSSGMMTAGIVLTAVAGLALAGGIAITAFDQLNPDIELHGVATAVFGAPLIVGSALLGGVGAALWSIGAPAPPAVAGMPAWAPAVAAGPRSAALRWTF